jgi:hypothetical protein
MYLKKKNLKVSLSIPHARYIVCRASTNKKRRLTMLKKANSEIMAKYLFWKRYNHIMAGIICLFSLAIGTPLALLVGTGAIIAVLVFYKGD